MADKITNCRTIRNADTSIDIHRVYYELVNGSDKTHVAILVKASEMTDPEDMTEVETKANAKAATAKTNWIASLVNTQTMTTSAVINGDVTL